MWRIARTGRIGRVLAGSAAAANEEGATAEALDAGGWIKYGDFGNGPRSCFAYAMLKDN